MTVDVSVWRIRDVIADLYEVRDEIKTGGMGRVYRVWHRGWSMELAVKVPKPDLVTSPVSMANFETEAQTWVELGLHPNVVSCVYVRRLDGLPRVFAEWVDGGTLAEAVRNRALYQGSRDDALGRMIDVAIQFAWGLEHAHANGSIHQDVKPANTMLTADGVAKVTDFGLAGARVAAGERDADRSPDVLASFSGGMTPAYCSPEQGQAAAALDAGLQPQPLTRATDVWSWAISVLEMFFGEPPCLGGGQTAGEVLESFLSDGARSEDPTIPPMPLGISELLRRCFQLDPAARPSDMSAIADELTQLYATLLGLPYPRTRPTRADLLADGLNNQALSMLDLGHHEQAEHLWEAALRADAQHPQSVYNRGLFRWRRGEITDEQLVEMLDAVRDSHPSDPLCAELLAAVHLERSGPRVGQISARDLAGEVGVSELPPPRLLAGHTAKVCSLVVSDEAGLLLSASKDGSVRYWDLATGESLGDFDTGHEHGLSELAVAANMQTAISAGVWDSTPRLWGLVERRCLAMTGHPAWVTAADIDTDGHLAISGHNDGTACVWEVAAGRLVQVLTGHQGPVRVLTFAGRGRYAVSAGKDDTVVRISEVRTGRVLQRFDCGEPVGKVAVSADDRYLLTSSRKSPCIRVWDIGDQRCLRTLDDHPGSVHSLRLSHDGHLLVVGCTEGEVVVWHVDTGRRLRVFTGRTGIHPQVAFGPPGIVVSAHSTMDGLRVWQLGQGRCLCTVRVCTGGPLVVSADGHTAITAAEDGTIAVSAIPAGAGRAAPWQYVRPRSAAEISSDAQWVEAAIARATAYGNAGDKAEAEEQIRSARAVPGFRRDPRLFDQWRQLGRFRPLGRLSDGWHRRCLTGHTGGVTAVALSADASLAVSGGMDGSVFAWDIAAGRGEQLRAGGDSAVTALHLSADGRTAISANADAPVMVWDNGSGAPPRALEGTNGHIAAALSADGTTAATGSDRGENYGTISVWDVSSGACLHNITGCGGVKALAVSPDGRRVLSARVDGVTCLWDWRSDSLTSSYPEIGGFSAATLAHDKDLAMIASKAGLGLWDLAMARWVRQLGHAHTVAWLPDAGVAACDGDAAVLVWDVATGRSLVTLAGHAARVTSVAISADAHLVVSGSEDGSVRVWALDWDHRPAEVV